MLHIQTALWTPSAQQPPGKAPTLMGLVERPLGHRVLGSRAQAAQSRHREGGMECPGLADALCLSRCLAQMSVMVGLRLLHTSLESIANPEDPECESEGWVLENSLKDTFKSALENLKKLGKFNQVEAGAEGAEGEEGGKTPAITTVS